MCARGLTDDIWLLCIGNIRLIIVLITIIMRIKEFRCWRYKTTPESLTWKDTCIHLQKVNQSKHLEMNLKQDPNGQTKKESKQGKINKKKQNPMWLLFFVPNSSGGTSFIVVRFQTSPRLSIYQFIFNRSIMLLLLRLFPLILCFLSKLLYARRLLINKNIFLNSISFLKEVYICLSHFF